MLDLEIVRRDRKNTEICLPHGGSRTFERVGKKEPVKVFVYDLEVKLSKSVLS